MEISKISCLSPSDPFVCQKKFDFPGDGKLTVDMVQKSGDHHLKFIRPLK